MTLAVWLALAPLRLLAALGLRRSLILVCLFVLAVTAWGAAEDLGLLDPPAAAKPAGRNRQTDPSAAARADIPTSYLRLYRQAAGRCPGLSWTVLAAIGKVESDHGRSRLPGVRSGWNAAGAAGPMQFGIGVERAGNAWARYGRDFDRDGRRSVYDPGDAIPAAANYLCVAGAPGGWIEPSTPTTTPGPTWPRSRPSPPAIGLEGVGCGDRVQVGAAAPVHCAATPPRSLRWWRPTWGRPSGTPRPTSSSGCARPARSRSPTPASTRSLTRASHGERQPGPVAALLGLRPGPADPPPASPACPHRGAPVGGREPGTRTQDGRAPHRQPPPKGGGEPNAASLPGGAPAPGRGGRRL
jgi:hypothetical protein